MTIWLAGAAPAEQPLSVIDWLSQRPEAFDPPPWSEPPVSENVAFPVIDVAPLDSHRHPIGLVPADRTGLPESLFLASDVEVITSLLDRVRVLESPAMQSLLYAILLSESQPPERAEEADRLMAARIDRLFDLGAVDAAEALAKLAGAETDPTLFQRWFDAALLTGDEDASCAVLNRNPSLSPDYRARIFCAARGGDWPLAELQRGAASAIGALEGQQADLLDRFLHPDLYELTPPLPPMDDPDPLAFRLYESIGEPIPTASLARPFANADLRDIAGWKAQVEASERLARSGALSGNRLLGLYTERRPAASGGVWDRVRDLQRFETALDTGSADAVEKTLPNVWRAMQVAGTEVVFADLFADRLRSIPVSDPATQSLIFRIGLLSAGYKSSAEAPPENDPEAQYLASLALATDLASETAPDAPDAQAQAIADGFATPAALRDETLDRLGDGKLAEVLLRAMIRFDHGARGNLGDLTVAIATLRSMGFEDIARRAALQLRILGQA